LGSIAPFGPGRAFGVLIIVYLGQHAGSRGHKVFAEAK
jgi:hypothetical protein